MQKTITLSAFVVAMLISGGCVNRTITDEKPHAGRKSVYGSKSQHRVTEEKRVWFWQDEFRNP